MEQNIPVKHSRWVLAEVWRSVQASFTAIYLLHSAVGFCTVIISIFYLSVYSLFEPTFPFCSASGLPSLSFFLFSAQPLHHQPLLSCSCFYLNSPFFYTISLEQLLSSSCIHLLLLGTSSSLCPMHALSPFCLPTFFSHRFL